MITRKHFANGAGAAPSDGLSSHAWPLRTVAAAALALACASSANALSMGPVRVLSALGEPLRAEIELNQVSAEEAASLKAGLASLQAFKSAGIEFNAALSNARVNVERRPDGRFVLRLNTDAPVSDPFIDLIIEASWSSGRVLRDYTLLLDPPPARPQAAPTVATPAQVPSPAVATQALPAAPVRATAPAVPAPVAAPLAPAARPGSVSPRPDAGEKSASGDQQVRVSKGETAGRIAAAHKPADVTLEQMLVALLRANPDAFIDGNINRVRAGALLELPGASQAAAVPVAEARRTISLQSANFNEFRRKLAERVPVSRVATADRQASGQLQTQVEDKKPAAAAPDKLTLSKGSVQGQKAAEQVAAVRQGNEAAARVAELSRNISELGRLQASGAPGTASKGAASSAGTTGAPALPSPSASRPTATPAGASSAPARAASAGIAGPAAVASASGGDGGKTATAAALSPASSAASAAGLSAAPASAASAPVATTSAAASATQPASVPSAAASKPKVAPPPPPAEERSLLDALENPLVPAVGAGLVALLGGFLFYRTRQRKKSAQVDSSFLESRLQPDSFFGSSGGQRIDTAEASIAASSMVYSPSQLDAAGDVDPVAEADVYLAYGRDLQAEEILKEALRINPARVAIHGKLLEIYAKRRDMKAFEVLAAEAQKMTGGAGPEWERIASLGQELDPENSLYQPGGHVAPPPQPTAEVVPPFASSTIPVPVASHEDERAGPPSVPVDLDLGDLDFSTDPAHAVGQSAARPAPADPEPSAPVPLDFSMDEFMAAADVDATPASTPAVAPPVTTAPVIAPVADAGMIEFDLNSLSLDLDPAAASSAPVDAVDQGGAPAMDAMETKLALAQEFHAIGDSDAARALVQEVVAQASGPVKGKAQRFLAELG